MVGRCASLIVAGLFALWAAPLDAQEPSRNRLYGEFLGAGFVYSLNYERQVSTPLSIRVGAGGWPEPGSQYYVGFGMALIRFGRGDHSAYVGAGGGIAWVVDIDFIESTNETAGYAIGLVAYQFQPAPRGFFLRLSYTPLVPAVPLWDGFTLGWAF